MSGQRAVGQGSKNDSVCGGSRRYSWCELVFHLGVQVWKRVIGHAWEHVVFHVIIHVRVQKSEQWVHVHRARVVAVIEHILLKTSVLGDTKKYNKPPAINCWSTDERYGEKRAVGETENHGSDDNADDGARLDNHPFPFRCRNKFFCIFINSSKRMADKSAEQFSPTLEVSERKDRTPDTGWSLEDDLSVTASDDGVGVVAVVRPSPYGRPSKELK